jgi:4-diphosphocytidyl-2-C-methyl-D-erythritol kinase
MQSIALKAYAKINLGLTVLGRREDGFHELRTIYQSISLADRLEIGLRGGKGVRLEAEGQFGVPAGRENLAVRAAEAVLKELGLRRQVFISLDKRIPPGSGLGGASSDAAAVLRAVPVLCGKSLPIERLLHLAAELGSDVPFFLVGGRAVGVGRGEEVYPLPESPRRSVVILFPGEKMATSEAYRLLRRPRLTGSKAGPTIELFCGGTLNSTAQPLANDFEPLLFRRIPRLAAAKRRLMKHGAEVAAISGSGSALFGIFRDAANARQAAQVLQGLGGHVWTARTISRREFSRLGSVARSR